jgi:peptide/nickel transport system substrate-binding protein
MAVTISLFAACGPSDASKSPPGQQSQPAAAPRKIITLGAQLEPNSLMPTITGGIVGSGGTEVPLMVNDTLVLETEFEKYAPELAAELPSVDKGTWRLNPDGTMDTVWKLRPNTYWHDGTPLTSDDFVFGFAVVTNPDLGLATATTRLINSVEVQDASTFTMHWSSVYAEADIRGIFDALPRHLLGEVYQQGRDPFLASPYFTMQFVGLGPYKLANWQVGSQIELARFDQYTRGRPPLDGIIVRFINDPNTMVAAALAGSVDVILATVSLDAAQQVKQQWEGTGNQVLITPTGSHYVAEVQYRPEYVQPKEVFNNRDVRQAFYQAIDRVSIANAMTNGLAPVADSYYNPTDPNRAAMEQYIPQYPYDPNRAQALLAQAGWARGSDGIQVNQQTGARLQTGVWGHPDNPRTQLAQLLANSWTNIGVDVSINQIPPELINDREYGATLPGWWVVIPSGRVFYTPPNTLHTKAIPSAANRWNGVNFPGYTNPKADAIQDRLNATIDAGQRIALQQQLVQEFMGDMAVLPLYWQVVPTLIRAGITGPRPLRTFPTTNVFTWDRQ